MWVIFNGDDLYVVIVVCLLSMFQNIVFTVVYFWDWLVIGIDPCSFLVMQKADILSGPDK